MSTILITGGSGLVGGHLTKVLLTAGFAVRHLSRERKDRAPVPTFVWDVAAGHVDPRAVENVDHIIHLSGAGIADERWTPERLKTLYASRSDTAALLLQAVERAGTRPKTFISASGINYYGAVTSDHVCTESDPAGNDTIGKLTQAWEKAADAWSKHCRVVKLRTAVVLAREGGALPKLAAPARWGLSAPLGTGRQWMPWVHIDDLAHAYLHAVRHPDMQGAYNVAAPEQVHNADFMHGLAQALDKPFFAPKVPAFALRALLGEAAILILEGSRASAAALEANGFVFRHPRTVPALRSLLP